MAKQLQLLENKNRWQIDRETREVGRRGLATAREALAKARLSVDTEPDELSEAA